MRKMAVAALIVLLGAVPGSKSGTGAGWAAETTLSLEGGQFSAESRNCVREDKRVAGGAKLYGGFGYGTAVYEFQAIRILREPESDSPGSYAFRVSGKAEKLGAEVDFINPKKKKLSVYLYNFGSGQDANPAHSRDLDGKWWLWGESQEDNWTAAGEQEAGDGSGKMAFVSSGGKVRMLLHAPGGIPYLSDGLFFISRVGLVVSTREATPGPLAGFETSENAWMEEGMVLAKGIGKPPAGVNLVRGRILALRAAKAVAMRNLVLSLGNVRREDGTLYVQGTLVGVKVREEKTLPDGSVEVIVEMPVE